MSLMTMRYKMASKKTATIILWALIVVFVAGIALISLPGGKYGGGTQYKNELPGAEKVIATVNGEDIIAGQFNDEFINAQNDQNRFDINSALGARQQLFESLVQRTVTEQIAKEKKVRTWSWTLRSVAKEYAQAQLAGMRQSARIQASSDAAAAKTAKEKTKTKSVDEIYNAAIAQGIQQMGEVAPSKATEADYTRMVMKKITTQDETGIYEQFMNYARTRLIGKKLFAKEYKTSPLTEDFIKKLNTKEVKARWIFVAAKTEDAKGLSAAQDKAKQLRSQVVAKPATFSQVASKDSDDFMSKMRGGGLGFSFFGGQDANSGWVKAGDSSLEPMQEFLLFTTAKGEISPIVQSSTGAMFGSPQVGYAFLIVDDVRDRNDSKTFNWAKDGELATTAASVRYEIGFGQSYLTLKRAEAKIVRMSTELKYYEIRSKDPAAAEKLALELQDDESLPEVVRAAFKYQISKSEKDPATKANMLASVLSFAGSQTNQLVLELGRAYTAAGDKDKAKEQYDNLCLSIENPQNDQDRSLHQALKTEYQKIGDAVGVDKMTKWLKANPKPAANAGGMNAMPITMGQ